MSVNTSRIGIDDTAERIASLTDNLQHFRKLRDFHGERLDRFNAEVNDPRLIERSVTDDGIDEARAAVQLSREAVRTRVTELERHLEVAAPKTKVLVNMSHGWRAKAPQPVREALDELAKDALRADARGDTTARDAALLKYDGLVAKHNLQEERLAMGEVQLIGRESEPSLRRMRGKLVALQSYLETQQEIVADKRARYAARLPAAVVGEEAAVADADRRIESLTAELASPERAVHYKPTRYLGGPVL